MSAAKIQGFLPGIIDPYPGLRAFASNEEPIFRGRQTHVDELLRRLAEHRFLGVIGTSGSGKSSLVKAGLLAALDRGFLAGASSRWRVGVMRPGMAPIDNLARALSGHDTQQAAIAGADPAILRSSSLGLVEIVHNAKLAAGESLLIVVDQFEELFRYQRRMSNADGSVEASAFVDLLLKAAQRPDAPVYVVLTMRSDFLGDCAKFSGLPEALSESQYLIPRLSREQRRQAIEEPLRLFGATMTQQLIEQLLNDSGDEAGDLSSSSLYQGVAPDPLPVLQHALMRTYVQWKSHVEQPGTPIDLPQYLASGRMDEALNHHAEDLFTNELNDQGRRWAERIFRCLTTTELGRPVRRPTPLKDLYGIIGASEVDRTRVDAVLTLFRRPENSFLQLNPDNSVDIMHESLIWKWKRLGTWVEEEAKSAELYRDLLKDAAGKATWGEPKLSATLAVRQSAAWNADWAKQYSEISFDQVQAFLLRSRQSVRNQRLLRWFGIAAALIALSMGGVIEYMRSEAIQQKQELDAVKQAKSTLEHEEVTIKQDQAMLAMRLSALDASKGATQTDRDRIAKEKADLEGKLKKSRSDSENLANQMNQSTDLLGTVRALQTRLDTAQQARSEEAKKRQEAESKSTQLEVTISSLTKELASTRSAPSPAEAKAVPPQQSNHPPVAEERRLVTLEGHRGTVNSVAWNSDGTPLASASDDETVRLWEPASGRLLRTLNGHRNVVLDVAWSPSGKTLASASFDKTIKLWDVSSGQAIDTLQGHQDSVESVAWSPDGTTLASAGRDRTIRLWDRVAGKPVRALRGHNDWVKCVAWSPDGRTLASASFDKTIRLWEVATGKTLLILRGHSGEVESVAWSPDGKTLASASRDKTVRLWDGASGKPLKTLEGHRNWVENVAWSPDGKRLASASDDKTIRLWNSASGKLLLTLSGHQDRVERVMWSPDGKTLASASNDKTVRLWTVPQEPN